VVLKQETNDLLTKTGPGTPMNALFRQYWLDLGRQHDPHSAPSAYPARS
jgi:hypothetical protein